MPSRWELGGSTESEQWLRNTDANKAFGSKTDDRDIVLSIRPQYSEKILNGLKTVELRRRFPLSISDNSVAYIYSTSPDRALMGSVEIRKVVKSTISSIWNTYHDCMYINRSDFDAYFLGVEHGIAIEVGNPRILPRALGLLELRERCEFKPPRSFHYVTPELHEALRHEHAEILD